MSDVVRVLVVDDHVYYREGVKLLLATRPDEVLVVGEAGTGEEAVALAVGLRPDVVLMDLAMPGRGGIAATADLARTGVSVLVLTMIDDDSVIPALRAGARGYLLKDAPVDDLVRAIVAVHRGQSVLGPSAAERVQHRLAGALASQALFPELTEREHHILRGIVRGQSNREIAHALALSEKTVRNYASNVLTKLGVRDRAQAIVRARDVGYPSD